MGVKHYAGIGSRQTPQKVLLQMEKIGTFLAERGYTLRSGCAEGADTYFERGCDNVGGLSKYGIPLRIISPSMNGLLRKPLRFAGNIHSKR